MNFFYRRNAKLMKKSIPLEKSTNVPRIDVTLISTILNHWRNHFRLESMTTIRESVQHPLKSNFLKKMNWEDIDIIFFFQGSKVKMRDKRSVQKFKRSKCSPGLSSKWLNDEQPRKSVGMPRELIKKPYFPGTNVPLHLNEWNWNVDVDWTKQQRDSIALSWVMMREFSCQ